MKAFPDELCSRILLPIIRLFLRRGVGFQKFQELTRKLFIQAASEELARSESKANVSRIAVMTGLTRREVTRIYRENLPPKREEATTLAKVLNAWMNSSRFCTRGGKPRVLTHGGEKSEFAALVNSVSQNINAGTFLHEMTRAGIVERTARGIKLVQFTDNADEEELFKLELAADNLGTLLQLAEENTGLSGDDKHLHLRTVFDNINLAELPRIHVWIRKEASALHRRARTFLSKYDLDLNPKKDTVGGGLVVLSAFGYTSNKR